MHFERGWWEQWHPAHSPLLRSLQQGSNPSQQQLGTQLCGVPYPRAFTYQKKQLAVTHPYYSSNSLEVNSVKTLTHLFVMEVVSYVSFSSLLNLLKFALWTGFWRVQVDMEQFRKPTGSRGSFKILFFWAGWFGSQTLSGWLQADYGLCHTRDQSSVSETSWWH